MWEPITVGVHELRDIILMRRMFRQDIAVPPMIIPRIDETTPVATWEGATNPGTTSVLTREGEASGMDNLVVPETESEPAVEVAEQFSLLTVL
jgi:hypothetical protein